jgi:hypothetical protein
MNGIRAVAVSGSACVIHHVAISSTIAVVRHAATGIPSGAGMSSIAVKTANPPHNPQRSVISGLLQARSATPGGRNRVRRGGWRGDS